MVPNTATKLQAVGYRWINIRLLIKVHTELVLIYPGCLELLNHIIYII